MSSVTSGSVSQNEQSKRSYIATQVFNNVFYTYNSSLNNRNEWVYTLVVNPAATAANCKAGHVLKENGRKLFVGTNPDTAGILKSYMVGVFDSSSLLNGFIDPNNNIFAPYSASVANFIARNQDTVLAIDGFVPANDMGAPVFTNGLVQAGLGVTSAVGQNRVSANTLLAGASTLNIDASLGQVFTITASLAVNAITLTASNAALTGAVIYLKIVNATTTGALVVTFTTNFRETSATISIANGVTGTMMFVSDGTSFLELSRQTAIVA